MSLTAFAILTDLFIGELLNHGEGESGNAGDFTTEARSHREDTERTQRHRSVAPSQPRRLEDTKPSHTKTSQSIAPDPDGGVDDGFQPPSP